MPDRTDVPQQPGWDEVFRNRTGLVGRDLSNRATRVQLAAKAQVGVRTGLLKRDITKNWVDNTLTIRIGSARPYALMHHEGTRRHVIRARNAKALRFVGRNGEIIFAKAVNHPGTKPNRYLTDNLRLATQ